VVIEDLVSTGGSSLKAVEALRERGCEVLGMMAIFTYGFDIATENFKKHNVKLDTLSNYHTLIDLACKDDYIKDEDINTLKEWREAPDKWKK
jgi:orotate phosphoribosyltransferase